MRRKDREMDQEFGLEVIDRSEFGVLSVVDEKSAPYSIPLSIARRDRTLYFHSAREGRKVDLLQEGTLVQVVFVGTVKVPRLFTREYLDEASGDAHRFGKLTSQVFTTEFESAVVTGTVHRVTDDAEKIEALRTISMKYVPDRMEYFPAAAQFGAPLTAVFAIRMDALTAKRKKYDAQGKEMKFQRMTEE